ncbi:hypothetical protein B0A80_16920 [Flavobacterium tructae]|uniref:hypothetical protein n=1 Tax=Flavobacterium tructae TaxID=1114873 RepID=UPI000B5B841A|nr:hypothetical protein [Flavobacterium tructae]OXB21478.1 hypothetical protein B0A80_16920 [Flavobacterium tructae]
MISTETVLLSACIGAASAILSQFIANALKDKSDAKKNKFDLIAEERKLTCMIMLNRISYIQTGMTIEYYYQLAVINQKNQEKESNLQRHHDEIKVSNALHSEYCTLTGSYCKNIYNIINYVGNASELESIMIRIINRPSEDFTGMFDHLTTYENLFKTYHNEHQSASSKIEQFKSDFHEMRINIERITKQS